MIARHDIQKMGLQRDSKIRWETAENLIAYPSALLRMDDEVQAIAYGADELIWVLEHPPLYTAGTSANVQDLVTPDRFPVHATGRGGQYTYHGPGQRIAYAMMNLKLRGGDVRAFVASLEDWIIATLLHFGVQGERREDRVGVWVRAGNSEAKIAALGIRVRQGITLHGISINISPELEHFSGIVPCGASQYGVTSLDALGIKVSRQAFDTILKSEFEKIYCA